VSKTLVQRYKRKLLRTLAPIQVGVGVSGGCEHTVHALQGILPTLDDEVVLQVDMRNAFNTLSRQSALKNMSTLVPELEPWASYTLKPKALRFCGDQHLCAEEGVQQGDPLGPAYFALATLPICRQVAAQPGVRWSVWYLDDGTIVVKTAALPGLLRFLKAQFATVHLAVNLAKCSCWHSATDASHSTVPPMALTAVSHNPARLPVRV